MLHITIDCEGPITQNDNAFELCSTFIPNGADLFAKVSKYDDYLVDVVHKEGYEAGSTLKLILPFLKANGVDNKTIRNFSIDTLKFVKGADKMLRRMSRRFPTFIISTSYKQYIEALCHVTGFSMDNTYCTDIDMNGTVSKSDIVATTIAMKTINNLPMLEWDDRISDEHLEAVDTLDYIFWEMLPNLDIGKMFENVKTIGGEGKVDGIKDSIKTTGIHGNDLVYIGDSITDVKAFNFVNEHDGISISFNGNSYAVENAKYACVSTDASILYNITDFIDINGEYALKANDNGSIDTTVITDRMYVNKLYLTSDANFDHVVSTSKGIREHVRGVSIGSLG
jgi:predicted HAD superfamily phosphohydrolase